MGLIQAVAGAFGGVLGDQWLEVIEADQMTNQTLITGGVAVRPNDPRATNKHGTVKTISNGSIIHVYPNQMLILTDGGKIVDYSAEPGYYKVDNSASPSLMNGQLADTLKETFDRFRFGGTPSTAQKAIFVNLQEIRGIKFGTRNPVNYYDSFYDAELFIRAFGEYSIQIVEPLKFFTEVGDRFTDRLEIDDINSQYLSEFMNALQSSINKMSADGIRVSMLTSKGMEVAKYLSDVLDDTWTALRGIQIVAVGINSISYDEDSKEILKIRNKGAMLKDASIREGFVQGSIAKGIESAGSNEAGAAQAFMGMGMGMGAAGNFMNSASQTNMAQMQMQQQQAAQQQAAQQQAAAVVTTAHAATIGWDCECGSKGNTGKFCSNCGAKQPEPAAPANEWVCSCGQKNTGKFCSNCGAKAPDNSKWKCSCGQENDGKFCSNCGNKRP